MQENYGHYSVMLAETVDSLNIKPGGVYVDCTLGGAGHSARILEKMGGDGKLVGIDRDEYAIQKASQRLEKYKDNILLIKGNFCDAPELLSENGIHKIDGVVADLGVSSFQLDNADRGFSYMHDAPLDMRMSRQDKLSAYDVVNGYEEKELSRIINLFGEERFASKIAYNICRTREKQPIKTTAELAEVVKNSIPAKNRADGPHPAKRTFQAIRIEVNGELDVIDKMILGLFPMLESGGRMAVITFHSLEDRIVKHTFAELAKGCECPPDFPVCVCGKKPQGVVVTKKPILPSEQELEENPRSRSAKLRVCEKI
ncbi:MAG: 16S rRNA (cytosine(1402)-N(4))-methyltransferase [Clostridiales bacterium]|nr:MAG: 16S rRNA (cytosine(1402)-N(4))-methyltransferase [Clostridiales bacterium]